MVKGWRGSGGEYHIGGCEWKPKVDYPDHHTKWTACTDYQILKELGKLDGLNVKLLMSGTNAN